MHMCGLCHALGDGYGMPHRLLTTHESILLNLLVTSQCADAPGLVERRCPLNPLRRVPTNQDAASQFAAAISVGLTTASVVDHHLDSQGRDMLARGLRAALRPAWRAAQAMLHALRFDPALIGRLADSQAEVERRPSLDAASPTAAASARIFRTTADLASAPHNAEVLAALGEQYGTFLYLADAYHDLADDLRAGAFNSLAGGADPITRTLTPEGRRWLLGEMKQIRRALQEGLVRLALQRNEALVRRMLLDPVSGVIGEIEGRPRTHACSVHGTRTLMSDDMWQDAPTPPHGLGEGPSLPPPSGSPSPCGQCCENTIFHCEVCRRGTRPVRRRAWSCADGWAECSSGCSDSCSRNPGTCCDCGDCCRCCSCCQCCGDGGSAGAGGGGCDCPCGDGGGADCSGCDCDCGGCDCN